MRVRTLPGVSGLQVLGALQSAAMVFVNLRGMATDASVLQTELVKATHEQIAAFGYVLPPTEIERLLTTQRYWAAASFDGAGRPRALNAMLSTEIDDKVRALNAAVAEVSAHCEMWNDVEHLLVPDTNVLLQHPRSFPNVPWNAIVPVGRRHVTLGLPIVVVDELDRAKFRTDKVMNSDERVRLRAGRTLRVLERLLNGTLTSPLTAGEVEITVRVLDAEWDRERTGTPDQQIIGAAIDARDAGEVPTTLVSDDLGMRLRAATAGLSAVESPANSNNVDADDPELPRG
ncbi:PIN domain-containing protein [Cellulomonas sp. McL0617]|uniref:PIN domain-containing protein n=1 Tax=Cellulomonas sp. McL0617 TaxID=3415675 RepID=UPI003CF1C369